MLSRTLVFLLLMPGLSACATLSYKSPESVNLSGTWVVAPDLSQTVIIRPDTSSSKRSRPERSGQARGQRGGERGGERGNNRQRDTEGTDGSQENYVATRIRDRLAMANTDEMTIEHVQDSMGILYANGKYRDIDWGETEQRRQTVNAGWREDELIVETSGRRGKLVETYSLNDIATILTVTHSVSGRDYVRIYKRKLDEGDPNKAGL